MVEGDGIAPASGRVGPPGRVGPAGGPTLLARLDPFLLRSALRAAVVAPAVLAAGYYLFDRILLSLFAWFAVFALLVFVDFGGPARVRAAAYAGLAAAGLPLITLGTLCSRSSWAACGGTAVVAFVALFAGVINVYLAVAAPALLLSFVLSVTSPAGLSVVPERLAGWGLGAVAALLALVVLWPARPPDEVRRALATACRALADCVAASPVASPAGVAAAGAQATAGGPEAMAAEVMAAEVMGAEVMGQVVHSAVAEVRRRFAATSYRPTGAGGSAAALGHAIADLNWIVPFALAVPAGDRMRRRCFPGPAAELLAAVVDTLHGIADRLDRFAPRDGASPPVRARRASGAGRRGGGLGVERLDRAARGIGQALLDAVGRTTRQPTGPTASIGPTDPTDPAGSAVATSPAGPAGPVGPVGPGGAAAEAFRLRQLALGTRQLAMHTLVATGERRLWRPMPGAGRWQRVRGRLSLTRELAAGYADVRAIWFRNSVRGAAGLTLAVAVTRATGLQHGFWVVLGTLSVLRSNALATGITVARALVGTAAGIAVGGVAVVAAGTARPALWALLPVAVLIAGYARKANAFAVGQAGFTVAVVLLFNIVEPAGWRVGLVRIEDVVLGFAISIVVGALLWPTGAAVRLVRERAAAAYRTASEFLVRVAAQPPCAAAEPASAREIARMARTAVRAGRLLDDAV
ncbi:FUSC family protein, partial [Frankia sp. AiPs1]|uniref:FUSC family protein n=1 Tax=Frankia sp. AiPs1 TaxID=573493 RepID=UPI0020439A69